MVGMGDWLIPSIRGVPRRDLVPLRISVFFFFEMT